MAQYDLIIRGARVIDPAQSIDAVRDIERALNLELVASRAN